MPISFHGAISVASVPANASADELALFAVVREGVNVVGIEVASVVPVTDDKSCDSAVLSGIAAVELLVADVTESVVLSAVLDS